VALLPRSAEIQPWFDRFVYRMVYPFTPHHPLEVFKLPGDLGLLCVPSCKVHSRAPLSLSLSCVEYQKQMVVEGSSRLTCIFGTKYLVHV